ncbi:MULTISPECIES: hypothetical protein [Pacificimonas]|uniref:Secreted protein n=1 Tax=Pacificimonas aurantium TaxID=1250540 RepID=A0ABS7WNN3_9SPHN|nr:MULTISPECIES: hypothetical protein [Pacificimonas]MBZ6379540.1 hypothetical protein [Pacificimonas aurantium]
MGFFFSAIRFVLFLSGFVGVALLDAALFVFFLGAVRLVPVRFGVRTDTGLAFLRLAGGSLTGAVLVTGTSSVTGAGPDTELASLSDFALEASPLGSIFRSSLPGIELVAASTAVSATFFGDASSACFALAIAVSDLAEPTVRVLF